LSKASENERLVAALTAWNEAAFLLHVGSCIPRKRIDVLLNVFAEIRSTHSSLRLLQIGGIWTAQQRAQIDRLGIKSAVTQLFHQDRDIVAALYHKASLVLLPSEAEGFGLPIIEALACGAIVVASDIPTVREVGGLAVTYCPAGDIVAWVHTIQRLLERPEEAPDRSARLARSEHYTWAAHTETILQAYARLIGSFPLQC
jgi:glycosyltransferase involved in cell wall biosynthesis